MIASRRSFSRELAALMPVLETEFSGQVKVYTEEEINANEVTLEIIPSNGYYAHASFLFRIEVRPEYPLRKPTVTCLTRVFHPNIGSDLSRDNVCLNLLNDWNARFGLKDLFHGLLFLFYEPNFHDPMNTGCVQPEAGLTLEETIRKSFYGGRVKDAMYEPNETWLRWAEEEGLSVTAPLATRDGNENMQDLSIDSPLRLNSAMKDCFNQVLSGQYSPIGGSMYSESLGAQFPDLYVNFAYICCITVRPVSSIFDAKDLLYNTRRYYYLEQCNSIQKLDMCELTSTSICNSTVGQYGVLFGSAQSSVSLPAREALCSLFRSNFYNSFSDHPNNDTDSEECESLSNDCYGFEESNPFELEAVVADESVQDTETMSVVAEHDGAEPEGTEPQIAENIQVGDQVDEFVGLVEEVTEEDRNGQAGDDDEVRSEGTEPQIAENIQVGDQVDEFVGLVEEVTEEDRDGQAGDDDEVRSEDTSYSDLAFQLCMQQKRIANLTPWWWILYQSRWPGYLAPRHVVTVKNRTCKRIYTRASSIVLHSDLFRVGIRFRRPTPFVLVDSLTLSPFSPILNRAVTFRGRAEESVNWFSLDWYSVWDAFRPYGRGSLTPRTHFYAPMLVFGLCYLHNWLAYMSRVELYGSCLGYSRPLNAGVMTSAAATCLTPASLGCGQCGLLDMWPLWLMWRLCRYLCRLAVFCCSRPVWPDENERGSSRGIRTRVCFPFSDLDEI